MLEVVLQTLKIVAILIGTVSGAVGTLAETRDKATGLRTAWSRRLALMIILSGVLAITTQAIESYLHNAAENVERHRRQLADEKLATILKDARLAAGGILEARHTQRETLSATQQTLSNLTALQTRADHLEVGMRSQQISLQQTVTGVKSTATSLQNVTAAQSLQLQSLDRLTHPLLFTAVEIVLKYPIDGADSVFEATWLQRVRTAASNLDALQSKDLEPNTSEPKAFWLLRSPAFHLTLNNPPFETRGGYPHMAENTAQRSFETANPRTSIHLNSANEIELYVEATLRPLRSDPDLVSWRDLHGAELCISIPHSVPRNTRIVSCEFLFGAPNYPTEALKVEFNDRDRVPSDCAIVLSDSEISRSSVLNR